MPPLQQKKHHNCSLNKQMHMKKFFKSLMFVACAFSICACSSDDLQEDGFKSRQQASAPTEYLTVTLYGKTYKNTPTSYSAQGDFIFYDEELAKNFVIYSAVHPDYSVRIVSDTEIVFFDNLQADLASDSLQLISSQSRASRGVIGPDETPTGHVILYDDRHYKDRNLEFGIANASNILKEHHLSTYGFNDKCSSLKIQNNLPDDPTQTVDLGTSNGTVKCSDAILLFVGYEDTSYRGSTFTVIAYPGAPMRGLEGLKGFNDKMSSFILSYTRRSAIPENAREPLPLP